MKRKKNLFVLLLFVLLALPACGTASALASQAARDFAKNKTSESRMELGNVQDALRFLLEKRTGGLVVPDESDIPFDSQEEIPADHRYEANTAEDFFASFRKEMSSRGRAFSVAAPSGAIKIREAEDEPGFVGDIRGIKAANYSVWSAFASIRASNPKTIDFVRGFGYYLNPNQLANDKEEYNFILLYFSETDEIDQRMVQVKNEAKRVCESLSLKSLRPYEAVRATNQYLKDLITYPDAPYPLDSYSAYGALLQGSAVCDGYARACFLILQEAGIPCLYVVGRVNCQPANEGHAWNMVQLDGEWYQLDVCWNDGDQNDDFFLKTDEDFATGQALPDANRQWNRDVYPSSAARPYTP